MQASWLTEIGLPLVLAFIMLGLGLSLTLADFARLKQTPRAIVAGLTGQLLLMPLVAYAIARAFDLSTDYAIGLMILAACPGGTMSNVFSHLARANLALSITLTAFSTLICVFTSPILIDAALQHFAARQSEAVTLTNITLGLIFITLLPVLLGVALRHKFERFALRTEPSFRRFSGVFMVIMIIAVIIQERATLQTSFAAMFWATLTLNLSTIALGFVLGHLLKLSHRDCITLGIEIGIQNATLAILIAVTFLASPALAVPAGVYGLTMYIGAGLLLLEARRGAEQSHQEANAARRAAEVD